MEAGSSLADSAPLTAVTSVPGVCSLTLRLEPQARSHFSLFSPSQFTCMFIFRAGATGVWPTQSQETLALEGPLT